MRRFLATAAVVAIFPAFGCARNLAPVAHHESQVFPVTAGALVKLDLHWIDADVTVAPGDKVTVDVDLEIRSSSSSAARRFMERNKPVFEASPSLVKVRMPSFRGPHIVFFGYRENRGTARVVVPPSCMLEIATASGDVTLAGAEVLVKPVRINTASGDVTIKGGARELIVHTASGDVRVEGAPLTVAEIDTASGDVQLDAAVERALIDTASGDVHVRKLQGELSAKTASGDVTATWVQPPAGKKAIVHTASGNVALELPAGATVAGEINTHSGTLESDFGGSLDRRERTMTFPATGADSLHVNIETASGDVTVRKRGAA